jgi:hypothetical protein
VNIEVILNCVFDMQIVIVLAMWMIVIIAKPRKLEQLFQNLQPTPDTVNL